MTHGPMTHAFGRLRVRLGLALRGRAARLDRVVLDHVTSNWKHGRNLTNQ